MSDGSMSSEGVPWLPEGREEGRTATVMEGAEVVRTAAVSYATPILHQVYIQGASASQAPPLEASLRHAFGVGASATDTCNGFKPQCSETERSAKEVSTVTLTPFFVPSSSSSSSSSSSYSASSSSFSSPSAPLWVLSSSVLSSSSVVLRPVATGTLAKQASTDINTIGASSSPLSLSLTSSPSFSPSSSSSSSSSPILSPFPLSSKAGGTRNDDELTSLSWLQDSNLLLGTALSPIKVQSTSKSKELLAAERKRSSKASHNRKETVISGARSDEANDHTIKPHDRPDEEYKVESPTSDYGEETSEPSGSSPEMVGHGNNPKSPSSGASKGLPIPYNPKIHVKAKPPFSFSCLIFMAIEESPTKALPVKDIYSWILDHYPYYRSAPTGWKNSVRHNLSLNKCFSKVEKAPNLGKGSLWMVDPTFRPNLLQAMSKTPLTALSSLDKCYTTPNKAFINTKYLYGLTSKIPEKVIAMEDFVVQNEVEVLPSTAACRLYSHPNSISEDADTLTPSKCSSTKGEYSPTKTPSLDSQKVTVPSRVVMETDKVRGRISSNLNVPNPELFPRLAKRLESHTIQMEGGGIEPPTIQVQSEDVDAAAAMLVLKHGPRMLSPYHENFSHLRESHNIFNFTQNEWNFRCHKNSESFDSGSIVISSSPSLDHAYVLKGAGTRTGSASQSRTPVASRVNTYLNATPKTTSPTSSVDEAFFDDSFENDATCDSGAPNSHPFEEADALLNLAAVATSLASHQELQENNGIPTPPPPTQANCSESHAFQSETQIKAQERHRHVTHSKRSNSSLIQKPLKRKLSQNAKVPPLKKSGDGLPPTLITHNNNNNNVLNRNKLTKVRELLKVRKNRS